MAPSPTTPTPAFNGTDSFTFTATDGTLTSAEATFTITVDGTNDPPVLDPIGPQTVAEGSTLAFTATASDVDLPPDTLTFSLQGEPPGATIDPTSGEFSWTAPDDAILTFDVCVTDGSLDDCETITVTVTNVAPTVVLSGPTDATAGDTYSYSYIVTDPGADTHAITESCGANATWIDTAALNSFDCHFETGPTTTTVSVTADDGSQVNATGSDELDMTVAAAGTPPTPTPSPSPSPSPSSPSPTPEPGTGELPDTALGGPVTITVMTWLVVFVVASFLALALGGGEAPTARRRVPTRR